MFSEDLQVLNSPLDSILRTLLYQLQNYPHNNSQIKNECENFKKYLSSSTITIESQKIKCLLPFLEKNKGDIASQIFSLSEFIIPKLNDPWIYIEALLSLRDEQLYFKSLGLLDYLLSKGTIKIDSRIINCFAYKQDSINNIFSCQKVLKIISSIISHLPYNSNELSKDPVINIYMDSDDINARILAAKLLDLRGAPVPDNITEIIMGIKAVTILSKYFEYTRATYLDLLYLISNTSKSPPILDSIQKCEILCSENLCKKVIVKLGWKLVNQGFTVKKYIGISFNGSLPLFLTKNEAALFQKSIKECELSEIYSFTAHGGSPFISITKNDKNKSVALFRSYNLKHADLLRDILDIAPLTAQKVKKIIYQLDKIVEDFILLFNSYSEECAILPEVYEKIKNRILAEINNTPLNTQLSAETTRLVQMFENPNALGKVKTLHGLKRYLHQKGLQLGFKLVDQSKSPNQSISMVLASGTKVLSVIKNINFANFESEEEEIVFTQIPYPVSVVTKGFERQLLHGQNSFPSVNIFCYGNEVHYFVWFRNHPVFIRIDFSPPLQGGMIDLQYFGVSNYEIADHPNIYLDAIRYFFEFMQFDVNMDGTHIQARYDKERALDLTQLCEKVEYLFSLIPYIMDLDWVIGSLNLTSDAKNKVIRAWAEYFICWGVLPVTKLLTKDKLGILQDVINTPQGENEIFWKGDDQYIDRFFIKIPSGFFENIFNSINKLSLNIPKFSVEYFNQFGQIYIENKLINYLREALSEGEIIETVDGFERTSVKVFRRVHEVICFVEIISRKGEDLKSSISLAKVVTPLEQNLKFQSSGTLEQFKIQFSIIPLKGKILKLYVLRDIKDIIRMAFFVHGNSICQKRKVADETWETNLILSPVDFISILRSNNYNVSGSEIFIELVSLNEEIQNIQSELLLKLKPGSHEDIPGKNIIMGLSASPGRAAGRVLLGSSGRLPEDFDEHIFVAPSISPEDNSILFHSAGIVATGGGILSHAGLIATQFNIPALIIEGKWKQKSDGSLLLFYNIAEFQIENKKVKGFNITMHYNLVEREHMMQDGDLVVLDADTANAQVLGQDINTIALFEGLKSLGKTNENILKVNDVKELLILRGKKLHMLHQIKKLFQRISDYVTAKYAVQEILTGKFLDGNKSSPEERTNLLIFLLQNEKIEKQVEKYVSQIACDVENKFLIAYISAEKNIPHALYPYEVVMSRLGVIEIYETVKNIKALFGKSLLINIGIDTRDINELNKMSIKRLKVLRDILIENIHKSVGCIENKELLRHLFRQLSRIDILLDTPEEENLEIKKLLTVFEKDDENICERLANKFIVKPGDGTLELAPLIGRKAANLLELEMLGGKGLVPPWFVITDTAFQEVLNTIINENVFISGDDLLNRISMGEAIKKIVSRTDISNREKSLHIRNLWNMIALPEELKEKVIESYNEIEDEFLNVAEEKKNESKFYIALRSSSCEEDSEIAAKAGEFETYLFINGKDLLLEYLKLTWSGLWTERAIHNRAALTDKMIQASGGVIAQRMVWSRVSGVLQTINAAKNDLKEIVINASLGLGEGVVSGIVAADQIIVAKEGNWQKSPLHFNYITADKTQQVLFNKKLGYGTVLQPTLYHQRFRPALEYIEMCELISIASQLEEAYGYPLDIEFAIEGTKLWILQVRPIATFLPAFRKTITHYPLKGKNYKTTQENIK